MLSQIRGSGLVGADSSLEGECVIYGTRLAPFGSLASSCLPNVNSPTSICVLANCDGTGHEALTRDRQMLVPVRMETYPLRYCSH